MNLPDYFLRFIKTAENVFDMLNSNKPPRRPMPPLDNLAVAPTAELLQYFVVG